MTDTPITPLSMPRRAANAAAANLAQATPAPRPTPASLPRPAPRPQGATPVRLAASIPSKPMVSTGHPLASEPGWLPTEIATIRQAAIERASASIARDCQSGDYGDELAQLGLRTRIVVEDIVRKVLKAMASMTASLQAGSLVDSDIAAMVKWTARATANAGVTVDEAHLESFARLVGNSLLEAYAPYVRAVPTSVRSIA